LSLGQNLTANTNEDFRIKLRK